MRQPRIFISYSHRDAPTLESLLPYLTPLEREGLVSVWGDTDLRGGERWEEAIEVALNSASIAVLLISQEFLASEFIYKKELPRILGRQAAGQLTVLPVFLSPSLVTSDAIIFRDGEGREQRITLSEFQGFGTPHKTLKESRSTERARLFVQLSERIRELASAQGYTAEQDDTQRRHPVDPPGALPTAVQQPRIRQIPHPRNPNFIGREEHLERLHQELKSGKPAAVTQAIAGLGGIGKTQLALEYSYRYDGEYNVIWWVRSEEEETRLGDLQALGQALGQSRSSREVSQIITATLAWLDRNDNWLLVFDNVEYPSHIRDLLPKARRGHIIITSRYAAWQEVAQTVSLALWSPGEAISYLLKRTRQQNETAAAAIAEALGYLPLALVQAAAYIEETGCSFADYLELLQAHPAETLQLRPTASDAAKVIATIWEIAFQQVAETNPQAVELLNLFAFLPPDRIPRRLLTEQANRLPVSLAQTVQNRFDLNKAIAVLRSYSLIDTTEDAFSVHRLVQLVVKERLDDKSHRRFYEAATDLQDSSSSLPEGKVARKRTFWWRPLHIVLALVILGGLSATVILVKTGISSWRNLISPSPPIEDKDPKERRPMLSQTDVNDSWSPIVTLRDLTDTFKGTHEVPRPDTGWWVTPIHVNLLADGRVLVTGWSRPSMQSCEDHQGRLNGTTFVLDPRDLETEGPKTLAITPLDEKPEKPGDVLYSAGHAPLADGRLLFMGGARYKNLGDVEYPMPFRQKEYGLPYARIFDPQTSKFTLVSHHNPGDPVPADASDWPSESGGGLPYEPGMMWSPTNTRLPGGKILTNGGYARWVAVTDARKWKYLNKSVTLFDPAAYDLGWNPWTVLVPHAKAPREVSIDVFDYPKVFVLSKPVVIRGLPRHVAIFGGLSLDWDPEYPGYMPGITFLSLSEGVPEEQRFATRHNARRPQGGMLHETTAVLLATGEILIMGGGKDADQDGQRIDVYDPSKDQWRTSLDTGITRQKAASTLLPDGSVLIVNGEDSYQTERNKGDRTRPTIYDPQTATFKNLSSWTDDPEMRGYHNVALLLKDGRVLVGGGRVYSGGFEGRYRIGCERPELRIFSPPYLFKGPRPRLKAVAEPMQITAGGAPFRVTFDGPELRKASGVVLMALGAFTHGFDQNQRYISLRFEKAEGDTIIVTPPESAQIAPEGYYNLFLISEAGVPSAGLSVRVQ